MPIGATAPLVTYTGNGVSTVFAYTFKIFAATDLMVTVGGVTKALTTDYSVSPIGESGNVTFVVAPANGAAIVISGNLPYSRVVDYAENGDLLAQTVDDDFDSTIAKIKQVKVIIDRAPLVPLGSALSGTLVLTPEASKFLRWNTAASQIENVDIVTFIPAGLAVSAFMQTMLDDASATVARATIDAPGLGAANAFTGANTFNSALTMTGAAVNEARGADIASASTINLQTATGNAPHITGTTTINAVTLNDGAQRTVIFDGILQLTNGASLLLPTGANIITQANDVAVLRGEASGVVRCVSYTRKSGRALFNTVETVQSGTVVNAAQLDILNLTAAFKKYELVYDDLLPATDFVDFLLRTSINNGTTFESGASTYSGYIVEGVAGSALTTSQGPGNAIQLNDAVRGNVAVSEAASGQLDIFAPMNGGVRTNFMNKDTRRNSAASSLFVFTTTYGQRTAAEANDAIRLFFSSGNIVSMNWVLYGYRT